MNNINNIIIDDIDNYKSAVTGNSQLSKFLRSYVICSKGTMTSKEVFDELTKNAKEEISLEMTSIKDMSYVLLITSLLGTGNKNKNIVFD